MSKRPRSKPSVRVLEQAMPDGSVRWLDISPAYDFRDFPGGYGIHGAEMIFGIRRNGVAVTWVIRTPFYLPQTRKYLENHYLGPEKYCFDGLGDVGYHSPVPLHQDQWSTDECKWTGGKCYADGSALESQKLFNNLCENGDVWSELEEWLVQTEKRVAETKADTRNFS